MVGFLNYICLCFCLRKQPFQKINIIIFNHIFMISNDKIIYELINAFT